MRKKILILIIVPCLLLTGCHWSSDTPEHKNTDIVQSETIGTSETREVPPDTTESKSTEETAQTIIPPDTTGESSKESTTTDTEQPISSKPPKTDFPHETNDPETTTSKPTNVTPPQTSKTEESTLPEPEETTPPKVYATKDDATKIAALVVKYINDYRSSQGTAALSQLPGLTGFAEYRSRQLVSNFAHDTKDIREAATALKYGEYFDPSIVGLDDDPYYRSGTMEAIAQTGKVGTVEEVAMHIATMAYNSSGHWSYVGGSNYYYVGVGLTYQASRWYCAITVSSVNNG